MRAVGSGSPSMVRSLVERNPWSCSLCALDGGRVAIGDRGRGRSLPLSGGKKAAEHPAGWWSCPEPLGPKNPQIRPSSTRIARS